MTHTATPVPDVVTTTAKSTAWRWVAVVAAVVAAALLGVLGGRMIFAAEQVPDDVQTLMLLGHNPGWEEMASLLSGEDVILKTANAALLVGEAENWQQAFRHPGTWKLWQVLRSREL